MGEDRATIVTRGLSKRYGATWAVRDLDLEVRRGEIFGFLGPNGAGKTTTIRMLCGLLPPTSGTAEVAGADIATQSTELKRRVGYLADEPYLYPKLTGREFLRFIAELRDVPAEAAAQRIERLLRGFGMAARADTLIDTYSHGMRKRIGLAATLVHDPKVMFLDEPTSGLDPRSARAAKDVLTGLAARGRTVFMSTHILEIAQAMCHRVGIVHAGRLVAAGTLDELRGPHRDASLEDVFLQVTGDAEGAELASHIVG